jgi:hypothetical protein
MSLCTRLRPRLTKEHGYGYAEKPGEWLKGPKRLWGLCSLWISIDFGVLRLGLFENRDILIRTLPKLKKILVTAASVGGLTGNGVGAGHSETGKDT